MGGLDLLGQEDGSLPGGGRRPAWSGRSRAEALVITATVSMKWKARTPLRWGTEGAFLRLKREKQVWSSHPEKCVGMSPVLYSNLLLTTLGSKKHILHRDLQYTHPTRCHLTYIQWALTFSILSPFLSLMLVGPTKLVS